MMRTIGKRLADHYFLLRIPNLALIMLAQFLLWFCIGGNLYTGTSLPRPFGLADLIMLTLATILVAAGGYVINDLYDVDIDALNGKKRNRVGVAFSEKQVWTLYIILNLSATVLGFILGYRVEAFQLGFIFPVVAGLLWFYSTRYKGMLFWGNIIIALLSALVILLVWLFEYMKLRSDALVYIDVFKGIPFVGHFIWGYALFAFLTTLLREWIKDVQDMRGDERYGSRTLPVVTGMGNMKVVLIILTFLIMGLIAWVQYVLWQHGFIYTAIYVLLAVQLLFVYLLVRLFRAGEPGEMSLPSVIVKMIYFAGILSMELIYIDLS